MSREDLDPSFLDSQEGDKRKNVRYRLDGEGKKLKNPLFGAASSDASTQTPAFPPPPKIL